MTVFDNCWPVCEFCFNQNKIKKANFIYTDDEGESSYICSKKHINPEFDPIMPKEEWNNMVCMDCGTKKNIQTHYNINEIRCYDCWEYFNERVEERQRKDMEKLAPILRDKFDHFNKALKHAQEIDKQEREKE